MGSVTGPCWEVGVRSLPSPWSLWAPRAWWWEPIPAPVQAPGNASPSCPSPGLMQELCHSRNLVRPSDKFVIQLVTARQGRVTNEHIQGLSACGR